MNSLFVNFPLLPESHSYHIWKSCGFSSLLSSKTVLTSFPSIIVSPSFTRRLNYFSYFENHQGVISCDSDIFFQKIIKLIKLKIDFALLASKSIKNEKKID